MSYNVLNVTIQMIYLIIKKPYLFLFKLLRFCKTLFEIILKEF